MYRNLHRKLPLPTGAGLVVFLVLAAILASGIARVIAFLFHFVFAVAWYAIAFVVAVMLLSALRERVTRSRAVDHPRWRREMDDERRY